MEGQQATPVAAQAVGQGQIVARRADSVAAPPVRHRQPFVDGRQVGPQSGRLLPVALGRLVAAGAPEQIAGQQVGGRGVGQQPQPLLEGGDFGCVVGVAAGQPRRFFVAGQGAPAVGQGQMGVAQAVVDPRLARQADEGRLEAG